MEGYTRDDAAERAGVEPAFVDRLIALGIVPRPDGQLTSGDVRRLMLTKSVEDGGISIEGMAESIHRGELDLDFLDTAAAPQGTLDAGTLANRAGVEGTLIAAYRSLDYTNGVGGAWGSAASNWIWGSVTSDDAYKGSEATDQPAIDPIELYQWSAGGVESELNDKWKAVYEGVVRSNATIRLLKTVTAAKPGEISAADAKGIEGEALFLRAAHPDVEWRRIRTGLAPLAIEGSSGSGR